MAFLLLPLLLLAPGYVTLAAWRGAGRLHFWERLFLVPFISVLLTSWIGIVLAEAGAFSLLLLSGIVALYCAVVILLSRRRLHPGFLGRPIVDWTSFLLIGIMALAGWAFSRPAEVVAGTFDPGIYLGTGATIAHFGSIAFTDPFLSQMADNLRPFLLEQRGEIGIGAVRLAAFWMPQASQNTVIPAFLHLYPVWLATLYSMGGLRAALFVSPFFGFMGVWALFLLGRRLGGPSVGLLAAALLAVNPAQIWFARYPISEATIQMLVLGGLTLWVLMEDHRSRLLALLTGVALGLAHLAKIDQIFIPVAIIATIFLVWLFKRREGDSPESRGFESGEEPPARLYRFLLIPYGLLVLQSIIHVYLFSFAYTWINLGPFLPALRSTPALAAYAVILLAVLASVLFRDEANAAGHWLVAHRVRLSLGLAAIVGCVALYGYFFWPLNPDAGSSAFLSTDGVTPIYLKMFREQGLVRLGWYLSPLGLLLGLGGFVWFVGRGASRRAWPLLILFICQTVFYLLTAGMAYPVHFWASRRYVPLVIPAFLLLASLAIVKLRFRYGREGDEPPARLYSRLLPYVVPAALAVALAVFSLQTDNTFLWQTEYQGALSSLERWAGEIQDPAVVLFKPRTEANIFASPLQNFFGKTAFLLQKEMDDQFYSQGVQQWLAQGKQVYLVLSDRYPKYISGDINYRLIDDQRMGFQAMEQTSDRLPERVTPISFPLELYRLEPSAGYPYRLEMGPLQIDQTLQLHLNRPSTQSLRVTLQARSSGQNYQPLSILLNGEPKQDLTVGPEGGTYQVTLPISEPQSENTVDIDLQAAAASGSDTGGIVLEWVEVTEAHGP